VSQENVEIVRAAYGHLNRGDVESLIDLCADDFLMDMSERVFNPDIYRGGDGIRRFYRGVGSVWESYRWDVEEARAEGDSVVAILHCHGQSRDGGATGGLARRLAVEVPKRAGRVASVLSRHS
jgi:ketosteroid isomerase-like protein